MAPPVPVVRVARVRDLPAVLEMWEAFQRELARKYAPLVRLTRDTQARVAEHFKHLRRMRQVWVLWCGETPMGYAAVVANLSPLDLPFSSATVTDLYLQPGCRGQGLGGRLLARVVADVSARGLDAVTLTVAVGNPARHLYLQHGFLPWQETMVKPCTPVARRKLARLGRRS